MWRFATGEDREAQRKAVRQMTEEEEKALLKAFTFPGPDGKPIKLVLKEVMSRRKLKAGFEYEVSWVGQSADKNSWMPRQAIEAGDPAFGKMLDAYDAKMAAQEGSVATPLTQANIAKHLAQLGLEQEFTLHSRIRGLSGGQKVKVVIGAATWNHPQIIILDEPTNCAFCVVVWGVHARVRSSPPPPSHPAGCEPSLSPLCRMPSARLTLPDCASSAAHAW